MKTVKISITFLILFILLNCHEKKSKRILNNEINIVYVQESGVSIRKIGDSMQNTMSDSNAKLHLLGKSGRIRVIVDNSISINRLLNVINQIYRPMDISIEIELNSKNINNESINLNLNSAILEFPLADGNRTHWQFQVADFLKSGSTTHYEGFDERSGISYYRLHYKETGFNLGDQKVSLLDFEEILKKSKSNRVAVGLNIIYGNGSAVDLIKMMAMIEQKNGKVVVENTKSIGSVSE